MDGIGTLGVAPARARRGSDTRAAPGDVLPRDESGHLEQRGCARRGLPNVGPAGIVGAPPGPLFLCPPEHTLTNGVWRDLSSYRESSSHRCRRGAGRFKRLPGAGLGDCLWREPRGARRGSHGHAGRAIRFFCYRRIVRVRLRRAQLDVQRPGRARSGDHAAVGARQKILDTRCAVAKGEQVFCSPILVAA